MTVGFDRTGIAVISTIVAGLIILAATASVGLYNIDEVMYVLSAEALHNSGSWAVQNGRDALTSDDLRIWLLVNGPQGLVSQYPVGTSVAAAPLIEFFGQKSLIVLNVLAGVGTLFTTHALARRLFGSTDVANVAVVLLALCTFWTEYVTGHWPHSISILCVSLSCLLFLVALDRTRLAWHPAVWSGVFVGLGMFFRLEGILLLPAIVALTILYAKRPVQILVGGILGFVPMMILMALSNMVRFGTFNPLSYGQEGGGTDIASYLVPGLAILICLAGLVIARQLSGFRHRGAVGFLVAAILILSAVLVPPIQSSLLKIVNGIYAILIDSTAIQENRPRAMNRRPDGSILFWGLPKKALGQSLPWLGCLGALAGLAWGNRRRSILVVLVIFAAWSVPFIVRSWHGGMGSNMRYFLPTLPLLMALSAWVILELGKRLHENDVRIVLVPAVALYFLTSGWLFFAPDQLPWIHQIVSVNLLIAIAALSLSAGFLPQRIPTLLSLCAIGAGLGLSSDIAIHDYSSAQKQRASNAAYSNAVSTIPGRVLFYGEPTKFYPALGNPEQLVALHGPLELEFDFDFIEDACRSEYRTFFQNYMTQYLAPLEDRLIDFTWESGGEVVRLKELDCNL